MVAVAEWPVDHLAAVNLKLGKVVCCLEYG